MVFATGFADEEFIFGGTAGMLTGVGDKLAFGAEDALTAGKCVLV
jgi:hypothetical protein